MSRRERWTFSIAVGLTALVAGCARRWFFPAAFPPVWVDEIHFLVPSSPWGSGYTFDASGSLNPHGLYWLPAGYTVFHATLAALFGETTLATARLGSLWLTLIAALALAFVERAFTRNDSWLRAAVIMASWFAALPIVIASNFARPEALVLALSLWGLFAALKRYLVLSIGITVLTLGVHPLLALPMLAQTWILLWYPKTRRSPRVLAVITLAAALALVCLELRLWLMHQDTYLADWRFQLLRKGARAWTARAILAAAAMLGGILYATSARAWKRLAETQYELCIVGSSGFAYLTVYGYGREAWYPPFVITGSVLLLLCVVRACEDRELLRALVPRAVVLARCVTCAVVAIPLFTWSRALQQRNVQSLQFEPSSFAEQSSDMREVDELVQQTTHDSHGDVLIAARLGSAILTKLQRHQVYTANPRSEPGLQQFRRVVFESAAGEIPEELLRVLSGHTCVAQRRYVSSHGYVRVVVEELRESPKGTSFRDCALADQDQMSLYGQARSVSAHVSQ
jgi:hypothetical protein